MKIKMIFIGNEPLQLNEHCIKGIDVLGLERYYEKKMPYLYEYVQANKLESKLLDYHLLDKEDRQFEEIYILITREILNKDEKDTIKKIQHSQLQGVHICYGYNMSQKEIQMLLQAFLGNMQNDQMLLYKIKNHILVGGKVQLINGLWELIQDIFGNWHEVCKCDYVKINLYSYHELGITEISELENVFNEYTEEGARLEIVWHKSNMQRERIYFLLNGWNK